MYALAFAVIVLKIDSVAESFPRRSKEFVILSLSELLRLVAGYSSCVLTLCFSGCGFLVSSIIH